VQQAEEAAAEAEAERLRDLGLEVQRRVVELQLGRARRAAPRTGWPRPGTGRRTPRLDLLEAGQRRAAGLPAWVVSPTLGVAQFLDAGDDEADLARRQRSRCATSA
jgi:hypothetical protein